jgi:hypothetical protein
LLLNISPEILATQRRRLTRPRIVKVRTNQIVLDDAVTQDTQIEDKHKPPIDPHPVYAIDQFPEENQNAEFRRHDAAPAEHQGYRYPFVQVVAHLHHVGHVWGSKAWDLVLQSEGKVHAIYDFDMQDRECGD